MARAVTLSIAVAVLTVAWPVRPAVATGASERWIVQVQPGAQVAEVIHVARGRLGVTPAQRFSHVLRGFSATMTAAQREALAADPRVRAIVPDVVVQATADRYPVTDDEVQSGIRRVGGPAAAEPHGARDVDIAVLDTGIQFDNPDLNFAGAYNCTDPGDPNPTDPTHSRDAAFFGHGTHVAGIAAARRDDRGVAGVADGARVWAIKVLENNGNGYWSWVICGLERVAAMTDADGVTPTIEVVNMSLASAGSDDGDCGRSSNDLFHQAVCHVAEAGITMVAAAGNESRDAAGYVPGAYDEVITVSAMADWNGLADGVSPAPTAGSPPDDCPRNYGDDAFGAFSNYGADIDLIAPGTCVISTLPVNRLGLMTGTSMATPHVAGAVALYHLAELAAGRARPKPHQVRAALVALGTHDWKTGTDPDRTRPGSEREPALFVGNLDGLEPSFEIGVERQIVRMAAGEEAGNRLWVARLGGFDAPVELDVDDGTLPAGAAAAMDGQELRIELPEGAAAGGYSVRVTGTAGDVTDAVTFRLVVFSTAADAGGPVVSVRSGVRTGVVEVPMRVTWPAVRRAERYQLQRSVDGSPWSTIASTTGRIFNTLATPGRRYEHRVRARVGGAWRTWQLGASVVVATYGGSSLGRSGTWLLAGHDDAYSEMPLYSTDTGARATLAFTGRSIGWIGTRAPTRGKARIYIDGALVTTLDLSSRSRTNRLLVWTRSWGSSGAHTIRIEVVGRPADRPRVDIDAFVVVAN